jgi:hypothetical protein
MPAKTDPRESSAPDTYFYRRALAARDLVPAIGVGVATGLVAFYLTKLYLERAPLTPERVVPPRTPGRLRRARGA